MRIISPTVSHMARLSAAIVPGNRGFLRIE
jgi:hypothetical protein